MEFWNAIVDKVAVFSDAEEYNRVSIHEEIIGISRPVDRVAGFNKLVWIGQSQPLTDETTIRRVFMFAESMGGLIRNKADDFLVVSSGRAGEKNSFWNDRAQGAVDWRWRIVINLNIGNLTSRSSEGRGRLDRLSLFSGGIRKSLIFFHGMMVVLSYHPINGTAQYRIHSSHLNIVVADEADSFQPF